MCIILYQTINSANIIRMKLEKQCMRTVISYIQKNFEVIIHCYYCPSFPTHATLDSILTFSLTLL